MVNASRRQQIVGRGDWEAGGDFALGCAVDFHVRPGDAIERQAGGDGGEGQGRGVTIAREMAEDGAAQAVPGEACQDLGGGGVREMTVAGHDPLLDGPGTAAVFLEEFFIVIGLDDDGVSGAEALVDELGGETEIGAETEAGAAMMKDEADGIGGIMGDGKGLDRDIAHGELRAGEEEAKILAEPFAARALDGIGGEGVAIDGGLEFFAEYIEAAGVIDVLVGDEDGVDGCGIDASGYKAGAHLAGAEAAIDEETALGGLDEGAVAGAAGAEDGHSEHEAINASGVGGKANRIGENEGG